MHIIKEMTSIGYLVMFKCLIKLGYDVTDNNLAIRSASRHGHLNVVKYLVSVGCNPKACDDWAVQSASSNGHLDVVKYLVGLGCDPTENNNLAIRWASKYGHLDVVKYLVSVGCDPKACTYYKLREQ